MVEKEEGERSEMRGVEGDDEMLKASMAAWKQKIIGKAAEKMVMNIDNPPSIANVRKNLYESRVAFVTTAGVHLKDQPAFDVQSGDDSYRMIPGDVPISDLMISHTHYDRTDADQDINCVFPLERIRELAAEGIIGSTATYQYGFMGYIPKPQRLIEKIAPEVADFLKNDEVDIVLLSPG
jgi:D-proline reductase (dithiol) PrdB